MIMKNIVVLKVKEGELFCRKRLFSARPESIFGGLSFKNRYRRLSGLVQSTYRRPFAMSENDNVLVDNISKIEVTPNQYVFGKKKSGFVAVKTDNNNNRLD